MSSALVAEDLSKIYFLTDKPFKAVESLNLTIPTGQVFGFLGPNGAGKTTTIKMICGLITPTRGNIYLNGYHVERDRYQAMKQIGVVLEGARNVYWQLSAWENLLYYGKLKGCWGKDLADRAEILLKDLELWDRRHESVGEFSRGTQQKVAIACALVANPAIVILDEPTLGLDVQSARMVKIWIERLAKQYNKTIIVTTHQLDIAEQLCQRVAIMDQGCIIADKPIKELLNIFKQETYQIVIQGSLSPEQYQQFEQFTIITQEDKTILTIPLSDPQQLYVIIDKVRKLNLPLLSATKINHHLEDVFIHLMNLKGACV